MSRGSRRHRGLGSTPGALGRALGQRLRRCDPCFRRWWRCDLHLRSPADLHPAFRPAGGRRAAAGSSTRRPHLSSCPIKPSSSVRSMAAASTPAESSRRARWLRYGGGRPRLWSRRAVVTVSSNSRFRGAGTANSSSSTPFSSDEPVIVGPTCRSCRVRIRAWSSARVLAIVDGDQVVAVAGELLAELAGTRAGGRASAAGSPCCPACRRRGSRAAPGCPAACARRRSDSSV